MYQFDNIHGNLWSQLVETQNPEILNCIDTVEYSDSVTTLPIIEKKAKQHFLPRQTVYFFNYTNVEPIRYRDSYSFSAITCLCVERNSCNVSSVDNLDIWQNVV